MTTALAATEIAAKLEAALAAAPLIERNTVVVKDAQLLARLLS